MKATFAGTFTITEPSGSIGARSPKSRAYRLRCTNAESGVIEV